LELHRIDDAERAFKAITLENDRYAAAYNSLGLVAIQRDDSGAARRNFERAIEVGPEEVELLLNLGVLYQKAGQKQQALHYLSLFLEKAPREQYGEMMVSVPASGSSVPSVLRWLPVAWRRTPPAVSRLRAAPFGSRPRPMPRVATRRRRRCEKESAWLSRHHTPARSRSFGLRATFARGG